jgi:hypothetical protein
MILTTKDCQFLKGIRISVPDDFSEAAPTNDAWFRARRTAEDWYKAKLVLAECGKRLVESLRELNPAQQARFHREVFSAMLAENPFENSDH